MFKNFLLESLRAKKNRPLSFIINWLGLTLGFAAVIVMYLFIMAQLRHDNCFSESMESAGRCEIDTDVIGAICPDPLARFMMQLPEVVAATRTTQRDIPIKAAHRDGDAVMLTALYGDTSLLEVLPFRIVSGGGPDALRDISSGLISRSAAQRLFGSLDVVGKQMVVSNTYPVTITGIIEDVPQNSFYTPEVILPMKLLATMNGAPEDKADRWSSWSTACHFRLHPGTDWAAFNKKFQIALLEERWESFGPGYQTIGENNLTVEEYIAQKGGPDNPDLPHVRPFMDCYFAYDIAENGSINTYNPSSLMVLAIVAGLILLIAIFNYINIYTARSTEVIRAMGIKSIMGASRRNLIGFIIGDSVVITFVSALTAYLLAAMLQPLFPAIIGTELSLSLTWDMLLVLFVGMPLLCGVLSGIFPAVTLTRMKPLDAIANRSSGGRQMSAVRNGLIVLQFIISIGLIASTLLINKQMRYINTLDMGYNRENILTIESEAFAYYRTNNVERFAAFRNRLLTSPTIIDASLIDGYLPQVGSMNTLSLGGDQLYTPRFLYGDPHTLHVLGVPVLEGDSISESNYRHLRWNQGMINEALAEYIRTNAPEIDVPGEQFIGVFRNFQHQPVTETVSPLMLASASSGNAHIRIAAGQVEPALKHIKKTFEAMFPDELYDCVFLDAEFNSLYQQEHLFQARLLTFSLLAIVISCLGLFALVGYSVERRRKEIAIRKVHGAMIREVVGMLCLSFLRWLAISFVIAVPLVWWIMERWMSQYAYRTAMSWWVFALAGLISLVIALFTVLGQSYKAAVENPAHAIKSE
ncbi:MAG TPA: ABC transporter permease [Candidatus Rikenella faecigallinarum]|uniref:ABC transporter permease n=1 Tax=Candidatus Rikenella faecigallinarum TaxID=2838745 RepID=A0A9D1TXY2_9BACT|nr:ABC transporter permease [Candidatus Rikenella faecigallinarum]